MTRHSVQSGADLRELRLNGLRIGGFDPAVTEYTCVLPVRQRAASVPEIEYKTESQNASAVVNKCRKIPGDITVTVTSEDGSATKTYTVHLEKSAEPEKISRTTSWLGNTFPGKGTVQDGEWVQNFIRAMVVMPDGTCYTSSEWDEAGRKNGIYKDGHCVGNKDMEIDSTRVICGDGSSVWYIHENEIRKEGSDIRITGIGKPAALAQANDGTLMIADNARHQILFYDISSDCPREVWAFGEKGGVSSETPGLVPGQIHPTRFWNMTGVGMDAEGRIYVSLCHRSTVTCIRCLTPEGELVWSVESAAFVDGYDFDPMTDGEDIYGLTEHYRMDYSRTEPGTEQTLYAYTLDADRFPNDPRNLLSVNYLSSVWIRWIDGKKFMFSTGMFPGGMFIWRFEDEIAVPCGIIARQYIRDADGTEIPNQPCGENGGMIWRDLNGDGDFQPEEFRRIEKGRDTGGFGWDVDQNGNIWRNYGDRRIARFMVSGLDEHGSPVYREEDMVIEPLPEYFDDVRRVQYDAETDSLYVGGYDRDDPYEGHLWGCIGRVIYRYDNWMTGNPVLHEHYPIRLAYFRYVSDSFSAQAFNICPESFYAAGDRMFLTYGARGPLGYKTGEMHVYDSDTAEDIGCITPGPEVGGFTDVGWVDIPQAVKAIRTSDGNYKVLLEEDARGKQILYTVTPYNGVPETEDDPTTGNRRSIKSPRIKSQAVIDGIPEEPYWAEQGILEIQTGSERNDNTVTFGTGWDENYLYIGIRVKDAHVFGSPEANHWDNDALEIFIDGDNDRGGSYNEHDVQYIVAWNKDTLFSSSPSKAENVLWKVVGSEDGYRAELAVPWKTLKITPEAGMKIGFDLTNDDRLREDGARAGCLTWAGDGNNFQTTENFGCLILSDEEGE